jgi:hypothetical protein
MSGLVSPSGAPLSQRQVRRGVQQHQDALQMLTTALSTFLRLGFFGRIGWLLFGARLFKPRDKTLREMAVAARAEREAGR